MTLLGATLTAEGVRNFVEQVTNNVLSESGDRTPICIWGVHGNVSNVHVRGAGVLSGADFKQNQVFTDDGTQLVNYLVSETTNPN